MPSSTDGWLPMMSDFSTPTPCFSTWEALQKAAILLLSARTAGEWTQNPKKSTRIVLFPEKRPRVVRSTHFFIFFRGFS
jgi:hypothetical protein